MGINFPNAPTVGQLYPSPPQQGLPVYQWDGEKWTTGPPNIPDGLVHYDIAQSLTSSQQTQARQNIYAAPFDALSYSGMQVNGSMDVSQANGTNSVPITVTQDAKFITDQWQLQKLCLNNITGYQITTGLPAGYRSGLQLGTTTAASMRTGDYIRFLTNIEGYRIARLAWGTSSAVPMTAGFWFRATYAGTYRALCYNTGAAVVTPWMPFSYITAGAWQWMTITFAAMTTGTWATDNTLGLAFVVEVASDGVPNNSATTSDTAAITGVVVLPGLEAPSAVRSPLIMRPYDQELLTCKRYLLMRGFNANQLIGTFQAFNVGGANGQLFTLSPTMRIAPTVTISAAGHFTLQGSGGGGAACTTFSPGAQVDAVWATFGGSSGLTVGNATTVFANTTGAWIMCDARL